MKSYVRFILLFVLTLQTAMAVPTGGYALSVLDPKHEDPAGFHKFYLSVTQVEYSEKNDALQVITRIFTDDMEVALFDTYGEKCWLDTEKEIDKTGELIEKYLQTGLAIGIDGQKRTLQFVGHKYEHDQVFVYLELPDSGLKAARQIEIRNELLLGSFAEQKNMTHLKLKFQREGEPYSLTKTWVFREGYTNEMLKL